MAKRMSLEDKFNLISKEIGSNIIFGIEDVRRIFSNDKDNTIYWNISKLVEAGYLQRIRNGVFKISDSKNQTPIVISFTAQKIINLLEETGFNFYISGIDILSRYLHHVPENYPILTFVEKKALDEIKEALSNSNYFVIDSFTSKTNYNDLSYFNDKTIILKPTDSFENTRGHYATTEKAFMDLFYEITREDFPLALQELARIYKNMIRNGAMDLKHLVKISYSRSMQYDIRYIVESKYISKEAKRFVDMVSEE